MSALEGEGVNGTVCNAQQYQQFWSNGTITCLTHGQSIGLAVSILVSFASVNELDSSHIQLTAEASFFSLTAVIVVLVLIGVRSICLSVACPP